MALIQRMQRRPGGTVRRMYLSHAGRFGEGWCPEPGRAAASGGEMDDREAHATVRRLEASGRYPESDLSILRLDRCHHAT